MTYSSNAWYSEDVIDLCDDIEQKNFRLTPREKNFINTLRESASYQDEVNISDKQMEIIESLRVC